MLACFVLEKDPCACDVCRVSLILLWNLQPSRLERCRAHADPWEWMVTLSGILQAINKQCSNPCNYIEIYRGGELCNQSCLSWKRCQFSEVICMRAKSSLITDDISDLMTIWRLENELADWDAALFVKSWLNCTHGLATDREFGKNPLKTFCENQLTIWHF